MKIILKQDVENLGRKGDIVNVSAGYGRNYLIPRKMALEVTSSNLRMVEMERRALKKKLEKERLSYEELVQKLNALSLTFSRKAGEKDLIFGSVSVADIREALIERGFDIEKKKIILEEPIKRLGNYVVPIRISPDDRAELKIEVRKEAAQEGSHESGEKEDEAKEKG